MPTPRQKLTQDDIDELLCEVRDFYELEGEASERLGSSLEMYRTPTRGSAEEQKRKTRRNLEARRAEEQQEIFLKPLQRMLPSPVELGKWIDDKKYRFGDFDAMTALTLHRCLGNPGLMQKAKHVWVASAGDEPFIAGKHYNFLVLSDRLDPSHEETLTARALAESPHQGLWVIDCFFSIGCKGKEYAGCLERQVKFNYEKESLVLACKKERIVRDGQPVYFPLEQYRADDFIARVLNGKLALQEMKRPPLGQEERTRGDWVQTASPRFAVPLRGDRRPGWVSLARRLPVRRAGR
jgi:hypothetical protein